jgi:hypothetical protein
MSKYKNPLAPREDPNKNFLHLVNSVPQSLICAYPLH